jgi:Xaa-Pro aminopeptidase
MFESLYQSFQDSADATRTPQRLAGLRSELTRLGLDGFLVPRADRHQNEQVPESDERLAWLTGFTGSAGLGLVLQSRALIFVDGRYTLQIRNQVDLALIDPVALADTSPEQWLERNLGPNKKIGYDSWLHTPAQIERFEKIFTAIGSELVGLDTNPIDTVWRDRPAPPLGPITRQPQRFTGETATKKLARIVKAIGKGDALLISDPHAIAWAFNIRGSDVAHTPLPLGFALIAREGRAKLYLDAGKISPEIGAYLAKLADLAEPAQLEADLQDLGAAAANVLFDAATVPVRLARALATAGGKTTIGQDPIALMKARKNSTELVGARQAQLRDAVALVRFLHWFDVMAPKGELTEIAAAEALETFRRATHKLKDVSFPTISAAGPNSALPHYRVTSKSNRKIARGIFLVDSGGQYQDGTTDVTRTVAVGQTSREMRDRFTRVLKGNIAISRAVFPRGTTGNQIDALARLALWQAGLDFDHGTGHGVGSYLSVHEGPQRIGKVGSVALEPGMIISNEPGYYKEGHYGIRIENLIVVEERDIAGAERKMLGFETITLAPIDRRLIEPKLLDDGERAWFDAYHARVYREIAPHLDTDVRKWLKAATKPIG